MKAKLIECTDCNQVYGFLTVEDVSVEEVKNKIGEIKKDFNDKGIDDWTIDDILNNFPENWIYSFEDDIENIIEI